MTSILKQEDRLFLYRSEKPFPKKDTYKFGTDGFQTKDYCDAVSSWFSSASRYECKDPERWKEAAKNIVKFGRSHTQGWFGHLLSEGIDVSGLKVEIKKDFSCCNKDNMIPVEYAYLIEDTTEKETDVRAIKFAEWISKENFSQMDAGYWVESSSNEKRFDNSNELYAEFLRIHNL